MATVKADAPLNDDRKLSLLLHDIWEYYNKYAMPLRTRTALNESKWDALELSEMLQNWGESV